MNTEYDRSTLLELGFVPFAQWKNDDGGVTYEAHQNIPSDFDTLLEKKDVLYAFVCDNKVLYIGKTRRTIKERLYNYIKSKESSRQSTNIKCLTGIKGLLSHQDGCVEILLFYVDKQLQKLQFGGFPISIASGLEDILIEKFEPSWND